MAQPLAQPPAALRHLVSEARELRERVHRVAIALSITEDMTAEGFEQLAAAGDDEATGYRRQAQRCSATADACRQFAKRLDELQGDT
jgi:hypothetical protein